MSQRRIFYSDERLFLEKKKRFLEVAVLSREIRALHEKMKMMPDGEEKSIIVKKLIELDAHRQAHYDYIDNAQSLDYAGDN